MFFKYSKIVRKFLKLNPDFEFALDGGYKRTIVPEQTIQYRKRIRKNGHWIDANLKLVNGKYIKSIYETDFN